MSLAAEATDIISIAAMKIELRMPSSEFRHDSMLQSQIESAVDDISQRTGLPLLPVQAETQIPCFPEEGLALVLRDLDIVRDGITVRYWTPAGVRTQDPDGTLDADSLGRLSAIERSGGFRLYPMGEWPETLDDTEVIVSYTRHFEWTAALRSAVVLQVRELYQAQRETRGKSAIDRILARYVRKGGLRG